MSRLSHTDRASGVVVRYQRQHPDGRLRILRSADELELAKRRGATGPTTRDPAAMLDLLLSHGAAADPEEFLGATPLHSAAARGSPA